MIYKRFLALLKYRECMRERLPELGFDASQP